MALEKQVTTPQGFIADKAYCKVQEMQISNKSKLHFSVSFAKAKDVLPFEIKGYSCSYNIDGANPIKQAYEHLKTLPEFSGATDC
jgi:hypothetical protein